MSHHVPAAPINHDQQPNDSIHHDPGFPEGSPGNAGLPSGKTGLDQNANFQPILPGLEECCRQAAPYEFNKCPISLTDEAKAILDKAEQDRVVNVGACLNIYPSGEITGGLYKTGRKAPPRKEGKTVSQEFTSRAKKIIRRAGESGAANFTIFVTCTFDPDMAVSSQ